MYLPFSKASDCEPWWWWAKSGFIIHIWLHTIVSHQLSILCFNLTWSSVCLYLILFFYILTFVILFMSSLSLCFHSISWTSLYFFGFIFFLLLVGGTFWCIWTNLPTDPNFLNFIGPMLFILESCAVGFTITPLGKEWSWSVSLWEIFWCYRTSSSIKLGNYWEEFYTLAWNNSLSGLSLAESSIQKGKEVLQQWVHFICLKKNPYSLLRVNITKEVPVKQVWPS